MRLFGQLPAGSGECVAELFGGPRADNRTGDLWLFKHPANRHLRRTAAKLLGDSKQFGEYGFVTRVEELGWKRLVFGRA